MEKKQDGRRFNGGHKLAGAKKKDPKDLKHGVTVCIERHIIDLAGGQKKLKIWIKQRIYTGFTEKTLPENQ